jgi:CBS domain containing-hemolysin-like protein
VNFKKFLMRFRDADAKSAPADFGALADEKRDMIRGVVELSETAVKEVMVPRIDTVFLDVETPRDELIERIADTGHSRFPVYKDTIDNVVGILYVKDLLRCLARDQAIDIAALARKPYFVPDSKRIDELLRELQRRRVHIAVVVDEYGGVSGIACMEDIIEEIVGDIQDEFDNEIEDILPIGDGVYLCDARVNLNDLAEELEMDLPVDGFDTLGGFVFDLFGKIPVKYEKASFGNYDFIIQDMEGHKINTVKLVLKREEKA